MSRSVWLLLLLSFCRSVAAEHLLPVGVLGNSGESGDSLVRVGLTEFENCASGVAVGDDFSLWFSGGDRINRLGLDGRLMESHALSPAGSQVDSRTFALVRDRLYFFGRLPNRQVALFALDCRSPESSAIPICENLPKRKRDWVPYCLAPQDLEGKVVICTEPQDLPPSRLGLYLFDPESRSMTLLFSIPGDYPQGVAVDRARKLFYLGAFFGQFVGGQTHSDMYGINVLRPDGKPVSDDFPVACTKTPATPTQFRGVISLTTSALWDTGWYGFLSRLNLKGTGDPGRVVQWHHELGYPTQVVEIRPPASEEGLLAITTSGPDALYLANWDESSRRLGWRRRVGCLPVITSLGLSREGWVTAGTGRCQAWWRFEDAPDSPPRKAELHIAVTPGVFRDERFLSLAAQYQLADLKHHSPVAAIFSPRVVGNNEAHRVTEQIPLKKPVGLTALSPDDPGVTTLFVSDAETGKIWQTQLSRPELKPDNNAWKSLPCTSKEVEKLLETATDLCALTEGRLLVAVQGKVILLRADTSGYLPEWQFASWGSRADQHFGERLRCAVDGNLLLVSDTERHRVLLFDLQTRQLLSQLGTTDQPGASLPYLHSPTLVALCANRAVIADAGNQRIVKVLVN